MTVPQARGAIFRCLQKPAGLAPPFGCIHYASALQVYRSAQKSVTRYLGFFDHCRKHVAPAIHGQPLRGWRSCHLGVDPDNSERRRSPPARHGSFAAGLVGVLGANMVLRSISDSAGPQFRRGDLLSQPELQEPVRPGLCLGLVGIPPRLVVVVKRITHEPRGMLPPRNPLEAGIVRKRRREALHALGSAVPPASHIVQAGRNQLVRELHPPPQRAVDLARALEEPHPVPVSASAGPLLHPHLAHVIVHR